MQRTIPLSLAFLVILGSALAITREPATVAPSGFSFEKEVVVPGTPEQVFDAFTGDVSPWWDHSFSKQPKALVIEPRPGGSFYETFDDEGNGCEHARVTYSKRGERLAFTGPLGLAAMNAAVQMVHTFSFEAVGDGTTRLTLSVSAVGALPSGTGAGVEQVWHHFLVERFLPHVTKQRAAAK